jgi:hypothetical protein
VLWIVHVPQRSRSILLACVLTTGLAPIARADTPIRTVTASARMIGCTPFVRSNCDGASSIRMGLSVSELRWTDASGDGVLVRFDQASRPDRGLVMSHTIAAAGLRKMLGTTGAWLQLGPGLAAAGIDTRTIKATRLLGTDVRPAFMLGSGVGFELWGGRPCELSLDVASSFDSDLYQVTASFSTYRF